MSNELPIDDDENYSILSVGHSRSVTSLVFAGISFLCVISPLFIWIIGGLAIGVFLSAPFFLMISILFVILGLIFDKGPKRRKISTIAGVCCIGTFLLHISILYFFFYLVS